MAVKKNNNNKVKGNIGIQKVTRLSNALKEMDNFSQKSF